MPSESLNQHNPVILAWLFIIGLIIAFLCILADTRLLQSLIVADQTRISSVILILFIAASVHCGWKSLVLTKYQVFLNTVETDFENRPDHLAFQLNTGRENAPISDFLIRSHSAAAEERAQLAEVLAFEVRKQHQYGWFVSGVLIKLGLLGTVIGFILMLVSVGDLKSVDISDLQQLIGKMTAGMGIALITTIFGLLSSMLLGLQYLLLDQSADRIVASSVKLSTSPESINFS